MDEVAKKNAGCDVYDWLGDSHPKRGNIKVELVSRSGDVFIVNMISLMLRVIIIGLLYLFIIGVKIPVHVNLFELYGTNVKSTM